MAPSFTLVSVVGAVVEPAALLTEVIMLLGAISVAPATKVPSWLISAALYHFPSAAFFTGVPSGWVYTTAAVSSKFATRPSTTATNWLPLIASVLVLLIAPGATFLI